MQFDFFSFVHLLTREAAYGALLDRNRRALHSALADLLAPTLKPGTVEEWELLPVVAQHLQCAGRFGEAHSCLCDILILFTHSGRYDGWDQVHRQALVCWESARSGGSHPLGTSAQLAYCEAMQQYAQGQFAKSIAALQSCNVLQEEEGGASLHAKVVMLRAMCEQRLGRIDEAMRSYAAALSGFEALGDLINQCEIERALAVVARDKGDGGASRAHNLRALALARESGSLRLEAVTLISLGNSESIFGTLAETEAHFRQAYELAIALGDLQSQSSCLTAISEFESACGDPVAGSAMAQQALLLTEATGNLRTRSLALCTASISRGLEGEIHTGRELLAEAKKICDELGYVWGQGYVSYWTCSFERQFGDIARAKEPALSSLDYANRMGNHFIKLPVLACLADVELSEGNLPEALKLIAEALDGCGSLSAYFAVPIYAVAARTYAKACLQSQAHCCMEEGLRRASEFVPRHVNSLPYLEILRAEKEVMASQGSLE